MCVFAYTQMYSYIDIYICINISMHLKYQNYTLVEFVKQRLSVKEEKNCLVNYYLK